MSLLTKPKNSDLVLSTSPNERIRLTYLDGLRGIVALYVVFAHIGMYVPAGAASHWLRWATLWTGSGRSAVSIFIILSGYCLMIPVVQSSNRQFKDGVRGFIARRSRRILPPYYASLAFALLLSFFAPKQWIEADSFWQISQPSFTEGSIVTHLLLIHNLFTRYIVSINSPLWTVAMEWQIYFIFAIALLPAWRRFGMKIALPLAFGLGLAPLLLLHKLEWTDPWYIGLFAMGMFAAEIGFSPTPVFVVMRRSSFWNKAALFLFLPIICTAIVGKLPGWGSNWKILFCEDVITGFATLCLLVGCTASLTEFFGNKSPIILTYLQGSWVTKLGEFSYSLYLIHALVLVLVFPMVRMFRLELTVSFIVYSTLAVLFSVMAAYGFHLVFEKPFMRKTDKKATESLNTESLNFVSIAEKEMS